MTKKNNNTIRICFQNMNGIPLYSSHNKNGKICNFLTSNSIDILAMSEVNVCWHKINPEERWNERTLKWFTKSKSSFSYLHHDPLADRFQRGGVGIMNIGGITRRFQQKGSDFLGRWGWVRLTGKKVK